MALNDNVNDKLRAEKKQMRSVVLARRDAMTPSAKAAASREIVDRLCALTSYQSASVVLTYMGFGSEIETQPLLERALADGKMVVLPRVDKTSQALVLHSVDGMAALHSSKWGILEPAYSAPIVAIEEVSFVLLPGVAFDRTGNRLGYGRGYYDKLLMRADPTLVRVAAGFSCQIVDKVPVGPFDQKIDTLITENEMITIPHDR